MFVGAAGVLEGFSQSNQYQLANPTRLLRYALGVGRAAASCIEDKRLKMPRTSTILGDDDCHNHNSFSREKSLCTLP